MAYFISVDDSGTIHGAFSAISAAYVIDNVPIGQKLVEIASPLNNPENYIFDWELRDIRLKQSSLPSVE